MKSVIIGNISESDGSVVISMSDCLDCIYNDNNRYRGEKCNSSDSESDSDRIGDLVLPNSGPKIWYYLSNTII